MRPACMARTGRPPRRRTLARQLVLLAVLALAATLPGPAALSAAPSPGADEGGPVSPSSVRDGARGSESDAGALRLTLIVALGIVLGCGVIAQYQTISGGARRRTTREPTTLAVHQPGGRGAIGLSPPTTEWSLGDTTAAGVPPSDGRPVARAPFARGAVTAGRADQTGEASRRRAPLTPPNPRPAPRRQAPASAQEWCAQAVEAAFAYDRDGTIAAFGAALDLDPEARPTATAGYWEMPSSGHADLARVYLRRGRPLDARSVLTVALLASGPNRELETLLRESARHGA